MKQCTILIVFFAEKSHRFIYSINILLYYFSTELTLVCSQHLLCLISFEEKLLVQNTIHFESKFG